MKRGHQAIEQRNLQISGPPPKKLRDTPLVSDKKYHVFLSFAGHRGRKLAFKIAEALKEKRITSFIDMVEISVSAEIVAACNKGIRKSILFVPLITPEFLRTGYPLGEVKYARKTHRKPLEYIIPVWIGDAKAQLESTETVIQGLINCPVSLTMKTLEDDIAHVVDTISKKLPISSIPRERLKTLPSNSQTNHQFFLYHRNTDHKFVDKIHRKCKEKGHRISSNFKVEKSVYDTDSPPCNPVVYYPNQSYELQSIIRTEQDIQQSMKLSNALCVLIPTPLSIITEKGPEQETSHLDAILKMTTKNNFQSGINDEANIKKYIAVSRHEPNAYYQNHKYSKFFEGVALIKKDKTMDILSGDAVTALESISVGQKPSQKLPHTLPQPSLPF